MKVAVHINKSAYRFSPQIAEAAIVYLAKENSSLSFVFIFDDKKNIPANLPSHCEAVHLSPLIRNPLMLLCWYRLRLPSLLKKIKADVFISNMPWGSVENIPQIITVCDTIFFQQRFRVFFTGRMNKSLEAAASIILAGRSEIEISPSHPVICFYPSKKEEIKKCDDSEKEIIKNKISGGIEYFIYIGTDRNDPGFLIILKAFSIFKKWQRSEMKLIILTQTGEAPEIADFSNYKFRKDVVTPADYSENLYAEAISGAYAGISLRVCRAGDPAIDLMSCGVPVIIPDNTLGRAFFGESCLYAKQDESDIAQKMILLYKDEALKNELIRNGFDLLSQLSPQKNAEALLAAISAHN